ncbi:MAG: AtpZ/AtpI family protein [Thermoguttaceae bacterium]|nr:AtpZ/AtpI family protein [Thermoguttaceae bacterium]MCR5359886.1 AtpZ/AtpI family protein [Thermoguttaceae bacterium]
MPDSEEDREIPLSPLAIGYMWSTRIITLSVEMGLIVLAFHWLDRKLNTVPLFIIVGSLLAVAFFIVQITAMTKKPIGRADRDDTDRPSP